MPIVAKVLAVTICIIFMVTDWLHSPGFACLADAVLVDSLLNLHTMEFKSTPVKLALCLGIFALGADGLSILISVIGPAMALSHMQ